MIGPIDVCCAIAKQFDIPEVEAIRLQVDAIGAQIWEQMLDLAADEIAQAQRDEQGPEWILLLLFLLDSAILSAPSQAQKDLLRAAAVRLGARARAATAVEDYLLLLRGRWQLKRDEIREVISRRHGLPGRIREQLVEIFGPTTRWIPTVSDVWAYRWNWIGDVLQARLRGVTRFTYWNPNDERTTAFCRWISNSGRIVTVGRVMQQINGLERAVVENDVQLAMRAWPLLNFTGKETEADFNRLYVENSLGSPPFHFNCRTRLIPV